MEDSYVVRCRVRYAYGIFLPLLFLMNGYKSIWLEKHQFQEPKLHQQPEEFYS